MKKILLLIIITIVVFIIYSNYKDDKIFYLSLGDSYALGMTPHGNYDYGYSDYVKDFLSNRLESYVTGFSASGYRSIDLYRDIIDNKEILHNNKNISIKQALIKADLVTLSLGINDIISVASFNMDKTYINSAMSDIEKLLKELRNNCKETIIIVGLFTPNKNEIYEFANKKYKELCNKYNIVYIDLYDLMSKDYFENDIHPNKEGYIKIGENIVNYLKNEKF